MSCEAKLDLPEGLCVIEPHSCGGLGYRGGAADGEVKGSYSLYAEVISRKGIHILVVAIFIRFFKVESLAWTVKKIPDNEKWA